MSAQACVTWSLEPAAPMTCFSPWQRRRCIWRCNAGKIAGSALTLFFGPFPSSRACRSWPTTTGFSKFILNYAGGAFRGELPLQWDDGVELRPDFSFATLCSVETSRSPAWPSWTLHDLQSSERNSFHSPPLPVPLRVSVCNQHSHSCGDGPSARSGRTDHEMAGRPTLGQWVHRGIPSGEQRD